MQQTSEWAYDVTSILMVPDRYDRLGDWSEESLAALHHPLGGTGLAGYPGTILRRAVDIFDGVGGLTYTISLGYRDPSPEVRVGTIQDWLARGKPVMVCWNDQDGHQQVIISYDTMGAETQQDDVLIVADPYDTIGHCQDGYGVLMVERFLYNFSIYGAFSEEEGDSDFFFLVASLAE